MKRRLTTVLIPRFFSSANPSAVGWQPRYSPGATRAKLPTPGICSGAAMGPVEGAAATATAGWGTAGGAIAGGATAGPAQPASADTTADSIAVVGAKPPM